MLIFCLECWDDHDDDGCTEKPSDIEEAVKKGWEKYSEAIIDLGK